MLKILQSGKESGCRFNRAKSYAKITIKNHLSRIKTMRPILKKNSHLQWLQKCEHGVYTKGRREWDNVKWSLFPNDICINVNIVIF